MRIVKRVVSLLSFQFQIWFVCFLFQGGTGMGLEEVNYFLWRIGSWIFIQTWFHSYCGSMQGRVRCDTLEKGKVNCCLDTEPTDYRPYRAAYSGLGGKKSQEVINLPRFHSSFSPGQYKTGRDPILLLHTKKKRGQVEILAEGTTKTKDFEGIIFTWFHSTKIPCVYVRYNVGHKPQSLFSPIPVLPPVFVIC